MALAVFKTTGICAGFRWTHSSKYWDLDFNIPSSTSRQVKAKVTLGNVRTVRDVKLRLQDEPNDKCSARTEEKQSDDERD
ncbi:unnamed protein product [Dicrocoelium dendriticum]|nr:unnamed protein product [Dicrocoelium dendriticum]